MRNIVPYMFYRVKQKSGGKSRRFVICPKSDLQAEARTDQDQPAAARGQAALPVVANGRVLRLRALTADLSR
jgi:hypothetical protein